MADEPTSISAAERERSAGKSGSHPVASGFEREPERMIDPFVLDECNRIRISRRIAASEFRMLIRSPAAQTSVAQRGFPYLMMSARSLRVCYIVFLRRALSWLVRDERRSARLSDPLRLPSALAPLSLLWIRVAEGSTDSKCRTVRAERDVTVRGHVARVIEQPAHSVVRGKRGLERRMLDAHASENLREPAPFQASIGFTSFERAARRCSRARRWGRPPPRPPTARRGSSGRAQRMPGTRGCRGRHGVSGPSTSSHAPGAP